MTIKCFINGKWLENCYVVSISQNTVIIDPGGNVGQIIDYLNEHDYSVQAIINTHAHFDHIGGVTDLVNKYKCPFYLHSKDIRLLRAANLYMTLFSGDKPVQVPSVDFYLDKILSPLTFGNLSIEIIPTPGHTEGSVCFLIKDKLFTGDTLLKGTVGRVDLPGGDKEKLKTSLLNIAKLPSTLQIYPGHGVASSIAEELLTNYSFISLLK